MENFKRSVRLKICYDIYDTDGASDEKLSFEAEGTLIAKDGKVYLRYDDSRLFDGDKTLVSISFLQSDPEVVTMMRKGTFSTTFVFNKEKPSLSLYRTPYMAFELSIRTNEVQNSLLSFGSLRLDYVIDLSEQGSQRTVMEIILI